MALTSPRTLHWSLVPTVSTTPRTSRARTPPRLTVRSHSHHLQAETHLHPDTEDSHSTNNTNNDNSNGDGNEEDPYTDPRSALQHPRIKRRLTASPLFPDLHLGERIVAFYHWLRGWVRRVVELLLLPVERAYAWGGWYAAFVISLLLVLPVLIVQE